MTFTLVETNIHLIVNGTDLMQLMQTNSDVK